MNPHEILPRIWTVKQFQRMIDWHVNEEVKSRRLAGHEPSAAEIAMLPGIIVYNINAAAVPAGNA